MIIRPIIESDLQNGYLDLLSQLTNLGSGDFVARFEKIQKDPNIIILVAFDETINKVVGAGTIWFEPKFIHGCSNIAHIEDVVVDVNYRSLGLGKKIIDLLVSSAKKTNCYKVILNCSEKNIGFYEKCGFTQSNVQMSIYL
uniref:N-acetyltransferase domain-containing protein n=1 Tax=viral metagenome TaxID=1070528 RepID=A0A6C0ISS6_9ZZZZ